MPSASRIERILLMFPKMSNRRIAAVADCTVQEVRYARWDLLGKGRLKELRAEEVVDWPGNHATHSGEKEVI